MTRNEKILCVLVWVVVTAGCACSRGRAAEHPPPAPGIAVEDDGREGATLEIDNSSIFDVRMFVVRGSHRVRLGLVISGTSQEFVIPGAMLGRELVFYGEAVGANARQRTDAVYVRPGQHVKIGLEKRLRSYSIAIH